MQDKQASKHLLVTLSITIVIMLGLSIYGWIEIPEETSIPIHWNFKGEADNFVGKSLGLSLIPVLTAVIGVVLSIVPLIDPRKLNILQSLQAYQIVSNALFVIMACLHAMIISSVLYESMDVFRLICGTIGLLFLIMGNYMGKVKSNFFFGIRTPWTLSSELSWNKTHRLSGKLFFVHGFILLLSCFAVASNQLSWVLLVGVLLNVCVSVPFSYLIWRAEQVA